MRKAQLEQIIFHVSRIFMMLLLAVQAGRPCPARRACCMKEPPLATTPWNMAIGQTANISRVFKNAPMQGAQKTEERGVYEKYVE